MNRSPQDPRASYLQQLRQGISDLLPQSGLPLIQAGRRWCDRMLVMTAVLMCWASGATLGERLEQARQSVAGMYPSRRRSGRSYQGFVSALGRHHARLLGRVMGVLRKRLMQRAGHRWLIEGRSVFGVDGTKIDLPRTEANEKAMGTSGKNGSGPRMLLATLVHLGTRLPWAWRSGECHGDERGLLLEMLGELPANSIVAADAGFVGWRTIGAMIRSGHTLIVRAGSNVELLRKLGWCIGEQAGTVYLWPRQQQEREQPPVALRKVEVKDGRNRRVCLLCTELSQTKLSDAAIARLYAMRWGVEVSFRWLKQTLNRRKMLSASPAHARREMDWTVMGVWMLGLLMLPGKAGVLGYAQSLRAVRQAMRNGGRGNLRRRLRQYRADGYQRQSPKQIRHWPRKGRAHQCGIPKARTATELEIALALQLRSLNPAA